MDVLPGTVLLVGPGQEEAHNLITIQDVWSADLHNGHCGGRFEYTTLTVTKAAYVDLHAGVIAEALWEINTSWVMLSRILQYMWNGYSIAGGLTCILKYFVSYLSVYLYRDLQNYLMYLWGCL